MIHQKYYKYSLLTITFITFCTIFALTLSVNAADSNTNTNTSKCKITTNLNSFYDKDQIETELKTKDGVKEVYVDLDEHIVYVTYDYPKTTPEVLCKAIRDLGYDAKVVEDSNKL